MFHVYPLDLRWIQMELDSDPGPHYNVCGSETLLDRELTFSTSHLIVLSLYVQAKRVPGTNVTYKDLAALLEEIMVSPTITTNNKEQDTKDNGTKEAVRTENQCCGSGMIYFGSGSSFEFSEFRIHADPDPTYIN